MTTDTRSTRGRIVDAAHEALATEGVVNTIELIDGLDPERSESADVFAALEDLGRLVESIGDAIPDRLRPTASRYVDKRAKGTAP